MLVMVIALTILCCKKSNNQNNVDAIQRVQAARVNDFLDMIGICGHASGNITPNLNVPLVLANMQYIGARKYRDDLGAIHSWQLAVLQALAKTGIKLIATPPNSGNLTTSYNLVMSDLLAVAKTWNDLAPNALFALEGPNEPINFPITYNGNSGGGASGSFLPVDNFQRDWYAAIKADPALKNIPVWSVTATGAEKENVGLQFLTIPDNAGTTFPAGITFSDALNMHVYTVYDKSPTSVDPGGNHFDRQLTGEFVSTYRNHFSGYTLTQTRTMPKAITEFGYHTNGSTGPRVDLATQAKNISTGLLNAFVQKYSVVCIYELYDLGDGFGIFTFSGSPRTSATYLHNLTTIMADAGSSAATFSPGSLNYTLSGMPATGMSMLFQKSDGRFQLVLWNNVINYDLNTQQSITIPPVSVKVLMGTGKANMEVFDLTVGTQSASKSDNTTGINVSLADYPLIIDILPGTTSSL